jgi:hypothetical protein
MNKRIYLILVVLILFGRPAWAENYTDALDSELGGGSEAATESTSSSEVSEEGTNPGVIPESTKKKEADAYLDELDSEVIGGSSEDEANKIEAFETLIKTKYKGSYFFYKKLPQEAKKIIYQEYLVSDDMKIVRKKILSLYHKYY